MPRFVVDSSVVAKWFLTEPLADKAREILDAFERHEIELIVPDLLHAELTNIFWKKQAFQGFDYSDCQRYLEDFATLGLPFVPVSQLFLRAFEMAAEHHRSVYDMLYVALAERENCEFISADDRLVNAISVKRPYVVALANWTLKIQ